MTVHKEDTATDVDAIQVWSTKELEVEFISMLKAYHDKETEFNWEARDKSITRLRGLLRGNATESPYLEVLVPGIKQLVDGIVKAVESLRTQLAVKALLLVEDLGVFIGKHLDNYTIDQILLCMMRCSSLTKKIVASASFKATNIFLKHTHFYPKIMNMLNLSMNEKNSQVRLYAIGYVKTLLQTHAHRDHTRLVMDRTNGVIDHFESILTRGLNDPTPVVKEPCREAFWIFWEYWRERGEYILKQLPSAAQKQLEKSKSKRHSPVPTSSKSLHSPTHSPRASSSLGRQQHEIIISPTNSNTSTGSASHFEQHHTLKRSMSPQIRSPPPPPLPSSLSSHLPQSNSTTTRKTRVPTLHKKKSALNLITKRKPNFLTLIQSDDLMLRADGFTQMSKKLSIYPYTPTINLKTIQIDIPNSPPIDGDKLKSIVLNQWDENYEILSSWDCVTNVMIKLLSFEEYIPKLILDANMDEIAKKLDTDFIKHEYANLALVRAKLYLQCENFDLLDTLFTSLVQYGGFVSSSSTNFNHTTNGTKKDVTRLPANRRKLTKQFLEWMDELVTPLIGLNEDVDYSLKAYEGVPDTYIEHSTERTANTTSWFESDDNVRQCLAILLPWTTSTSGTIWHAPLINFIKHLRLLNQRLFEMVTAAYDDASINKICRTLGIHIRIEPPTTVAASTLQITPKIVCEEPINSVIDEKLEKPVVDEELEPVVDEDPVYPVVDEESSAPSADEGMEDKEVENLVAERMTVESGLSETDHIEREVSTHDPVTNDVESHDYLQDSDNLVTESKFGHKTNFESQPNVKMTTQQINAILDQNTFPSNDKEKFVQDNISVIDREPSLILKKEERLPQVLDSNIIHNEIYKDYNSNTNNMTGADLPANVLYKNQNDATIENRTVSNAYAEPKQQKPQNSTLPPSLPNPEKYPVPKFVPFFAPEKVNYPNPVFQHNERSTVTSNGSTTTNSNSRNLKDKTILLYALIDKLKTTGTDHHQTFRKLIRLCKEVPIRRRWDQGGIEENGSETWAGANGDAGNFVELVQAIIFFLDQDKNDEKYLAVSLECIRQLAVTQAGLFRFYERKVDDRGMTLESQLMERLLLIRSNESPTVCIAAEDALDSIMGTLNPPTAFEMLMAFIIHRLLIAPNPETSSSVRYHPVGSAFMYLGKWVKEMHDTFYIDEWLGKGGVNAFFEGVNHPLINIRKSCVEAIVAFYEVIGDDIYLFLVDLREDQVNLLRHYVAKALKKKASLRNLRDNGQF